MLPPILRRVPGVAALCSVVLVACPGASPAAEKGVATDLTWGTSKTTMTRTAGAIQSAGAQWARIEISWYETEPTQGHYSNQLTYIDSAVDLARAAGAKIVMFVNETPQWESGSTNKNAPPRDPADYAKFLRDMVARYKGKVAAWEIWNEPNNLTFWPTGPDPAGYAALLRAAYPAVKASDPNATVLFGGLAYNDYGFLEHAYAAAPDLGRFFDVMATHPYPGAAVAPETIWRNAAGRIAIGAFPAYREVEVTMQAHGGGKPIWVTEFGWATTSSGASWGVTAPTQADYLTRAYKYLEQDPYVQVAVWYNLRNNYWANDADSWGDQLGLLRTDFTPKPSYYAFKNYVSGATSAVRHGSSQLGRPATRTTVRVTRAGGRLTSSSRTRRTKAFVTGTVLPARTGRITIKLRRADRLGRWRASSSRRATLNGHGRFQLTIQLRPGRWRVQALFAGDNTALPSTSRTVNFRA
jgi:polysaccharide biosynthesis protein PslG